MAQSPRTPPRWMSRRDADESVHLEEQEKLLLSPATPITERSWARRGVLHSNLVTWVAAALALALGYYWGNLRAEAAAALHSGGLALSIEPQRNGLHRDPAAPCDWTYTVEFSGPKWGLGSSVFLQMMGIDWALLQGRTILFDRAEGVYGSYSDFFEPRNPTLPCQAADDLYNPASDRVCAGNSCVSPGGAVLGPERKNHTAFPTPLLSTWLQEWGMLRFMNMDEMRDFPQMDSQKPLPSEITLPSPFREGYRRINAIWQEYFQPSEKLDAVIEDHKRQLQPTRDRGPLIALHWRAGDKGLECFASPHMSCGNVTLHAEAAWEAYENLKLPSNGQKPTLAIVTAESNAVELFQADPLGSRFDIIRMPTAAASSGFDQWKFNELPLEARRADMLGFLANLWYGVVYADAFIVSGMSNAGRLVLTMAGEDKIASGFVRSVDLWWHPGAWPIAPPKCMGRDHCHA